MFSSISLLLLIFLPLVIMVIINTPFFHNNHILIRRFVSGFSLVYTLYSLLFYVCYVSTNDLFKFIPQFNTKVPFLDNDFLHQFGISVSFGVDSLSVLMIILTSLIVLFAILSAKLFITKHHRTFYSLVLILESILMGLFTTTDMFIFFVLWELELIPMYLLISLWGDKNSKKSALKFVLYTFGGSLFILLGLFLLYYTNASFTGVLSADITQINTNNINLILQLIISLFFIIGFGVKIPLIPMHRWLADAHSDASTPVSMILAAILLKLGIYGIIRFNYSLLPLGFAIMAPVLALFAVLNVIYGAALAYYQTNIKRLIAYSSISQMGLVVLGLLSMNPIGYNGAVFHMISHSFVASGLFLVAGIIKIKFRTYNLKRLSGIANVCPRLFGFASLIGLAGIGVPFLSGFIGEFLSIYGTVISNIGILKYYGFIAVIVILLSAFYVLKFLHECFYSWLPHKYNHVQDVAVHEFIVLGAISSIIILLGCFPFIIINFLNN